MTDTNKPTSEPEDDDTKPVDIWARPTPVTSPTQATTTPVAPTTPAGPATRQTTSAFSPPPEPAVSWAHVNRSPEPGPMPGSWFEQAPAPVKPVPHTHRRGIGPTGVVLVASLISATLASGGTILALNATGVLDRQTTETTPTGQTINQQTGRFDESSAIIDAAAKVNPAVVQITSTGVDPNSLNQIPETGVGSGVIFNADGWILTNRHVVSGSNKLTIALNDGRTFEGTVYGIDTLTDLAIVKVDAHGLPTATMGDSSSLKVGQLAIAIGSPLGTYTNTVTSGIISAIGRSIDVDNGTLNNLIQTDTAINPGNSGGPLLDGGGNVIGIDTAVASNAQGIGFAIPINIAKPLLQQALSGQTLARPWIGIRYEAITPALVQDRHLPVDHGALVGASQGGNDAVTPGSPAEKAGIKDGDIVTSVEGITIDTDHPLDAVLTQFAPGRTVTVEVYRDGTTVKLQVTLGTRPANLN
jgi:S1-C subfamily serine protease